TRSSDCTVTAVTAIGAATPHSASTSASRVSPAPPLESVPPIARTAEARVSSTAARVALSLGYGIIRGRVYSRSSRAVWARAQSPTPVHGPPVADGARDL